MAIATRFAILGAGNGGLSMAGDLVLRGFTVHSVYDRFPEQIRPVRERGGVGMVGEVLSGFAPIRNATTEMAEAVTGADVIVVVTPAFAHEWIATQLAPHLVNDQIVLLTPGYPGGTLFFLKRLMASGMRARIDLAETNLILYATRIVGPAQVGIKGIKNSLFISALPASRTEHVLKVLKPAIPQLEPLANVLEVGFNCTNPYQHVPATILNWGRMEQDTGETHFDWHDWVSPGIKKAQQALSAEREAIVKAMGIRYLTEQEMFEAGYRGVPWKVVPIIGAIPAGSRTIPPRYISEDVPMGLVAFESVAKKLGVPSPLHGILIDLACLLKETDFRREGRTLEKMGLADKSMVEIVEMVNA